MCKVDAPGLCDTGGTSVGSTDLTGAAYPVTVVSPTAYVTSAGRYCWRGEFSSDTDNGMLGNAVTDTAELADTVTQPDDPIINLHGASGPPAGGTITFTLLGPDDCTTVATGTGTNPQSVDVTGNGSYGPVSFTPGEPDTYHWQAVYTPADGDDNNLSSSHNLDCSDADEDVVVNSVASSMRTAQSWVPNDSATISAPAGSGNLAGNVSFALFASSDCAVGGDAAIYSTTVAVSGAPSPV